MNLFDPNRPQVCEGRGAILIDGSAIPTFLVSLLREEKVRLSALLPEYESGVQYSYRYLHVEIPFDRLEEFFSLFNDDPEWTLKKYFNWEPQRRTGRKNTPSAQQRINVVSDQPNMSDLL